MLLLGRNFFVFLALGAKERFKAVTPLTRWIIVGICCYNCDLRAFGVFKFIDSADGTPFSLEPELRPSLFVKLWANDRNRPNPAFGLPRSQAGTRHGGKSQRQTFGNPEENNDRLLR